MKFTQEQKDIINLFAKQHPEIKISFITTITLDNGKPAAATTNIDGDITSMAISQNAVCKYCGKRLFFVSPVYININKNLCRLELELATEDNNQYAEHRKSYAIPLYPKDTFKKRYNGPKINLSPGCKHCNESR